MYHPHIIPAQTRNHLCKRVVPSSIVICKNRVRTPAYKSRIDVSCRRVWQRCCYLLPELIVLAGVRQNFAVIQVVSELIKVVIAGVPREPNPLGSTATGLSAANEVFCRKERKPDRESIVPELVA